MASAMNLPEELTARALTIDDVDEVVAMVNRCELADIGETMWERADLLSDVSIGGFDPERDWLGVYDADRCVAWAMLLRRARAFADVDPDVRGRGVGSWLRSWTEGRARELGAEHVAQVIEDRRAGVATWLRDAGYRPQYSSWILHMDHPSEPAPPAPPDGIAIRTFRPDDANELLTMFENAFSEFDDRLPSTIDTWLAMTLHREGFEPEDMLVAADGDRIVGGAFLLETDGSIWVDKFAVHGDYRHRGIARAMLQTAFRRSWELGSVFTELNTDSRTGALPFYERIGMYVRSSYTNWALDL
jgi:GNAT superfamily N-acetyltransferase